MKDKEFLEWLYDRLRMYHEVDERLEYMRKFRRVIENTDETKTTPDFHESNDET